MSLLIFWAGVSSRTGSIAASEAGSDTAALAGFVLVQGALSATDASDTAAIVGNVPVQGSIAVTEAADSAEIQCLVLIPTYGALDAAESGSDVAALFGGPIVQAAISVSEQGADRCRVRGPIHAPGGTVRAGWRPGKIRKLRPVRAA